MASEYPFLFINLEIILIWSNALEPPILQFHKFSRLMKFWLPQSKENYTITFIFHRKVNKFLKIHTKLSQNLHFLSTYLPWHHKKILVILNTGKSYLWTLCDRKLGVGEVPKGVLPAQQVPLSKWAPDLCALEPAVMTLFISYLPTWFNVMPLEVSANMMKQGITNTLALSIDKDVVHVPTVTTLWTPKKSIPI
jgi:hypothetical protein